MSGRFGEFGRALAQARAAERATGPLPSVGGSGRPRYPVAAVGLLTGAALLPLYVVVVLAPDVARTLGVGAASIEALGLVMLIALAMSSLAVAGLTEGDRGAAAAAGGALWSIALVAMALAASTWPLVLLAAAAGLALASVPVLHPSLLADHCEPRIRGRAFALSGATAALGLALAAGLVAVLSGPAELTWRSVFLAAAGVSLLASLTALRLRDPGAGRFERALVGGSGPAPAPEPTARLGPLEAARALLAVPTVRRLLVAQAALGALAVPLIPRLAFFLEDRWSIGPAGRGAVIAAAAVAAAAALVLLAGDVERRLGGGPGLALTGSAGAFAAAAAALVVAVVLPSVEAAVSLVCVTFACLAVGQVLAVAALMHVVRPERRPYAGALAAIAFAGIGGLGGVVALAGAQESFGSSGTLSALAFAALGAAVAAGRAGAGADEDADTALAGVADAVAVETARAAGAAVPLLSCRGVTVEYDGRRALDGVDLDLAGGELLALLGTNASGKTTLLRAISGLVLPRTGTIRLDGHDLASVDPERRVRLGIRHMPGGRATFAPLTVDESLRLAARAAGLRSARARQAIGEAYARFPSLDRRRSVQGAALSAGEQHMLGLAVALLERPRLLLVDELSMGLAPTVIPDLVAALRDLHTSGVAIVAAEQSLEVALALGGRACFLERGELRYDGPISGLVTRRDLLRPVFLRAADSGAAPTPDPPVTGTLDR